MHMIPEQIPPRPKWYPAVISKAQGGCVFCPYASSSFPLDVEQVFHSPCEVCDEAVLDPPPKLCAFCAHLRLRHLLVCHGRSLSVVFGSVAERASEYCDVCRFIVNAVHQDLMLLYLAPDHAMFHGKIRLRFQGSGRKIFGWIVESFTEHNHSEGITPTGKLVIYKGLIKYDRDLNPTVLSPMVNWEEIQEWIASSISNSIAKTSRASSLPVDRFRVVDVVNRCVVQPSLPCRFATLSYVWGAHTQEFPYQTIPSLDLDIQRIPGFLDSYSLPPTISDAITACANLSIHFLWIDALCIPQDPATKLLHISRMDSIYLLSSICLVAASGKNSLHGLPGVCSLRRRKWNALHTRISSDLELAADLTAADSAVINSVWSTRGWTYQESLLSRRMLCFTEFGATLVIRDTNKGSATSFSILEQYFEKSPKSKMPLPIHTLESNRKYRRVVEEYSLRTLSFKSDVLRALSGVLNYLCGVSGHSYGLPHENFGAAIAWTTSDRSGSWMEEFVPCEDGEVFPSWSWARASIKGKIWFAPEAREVACWGLVNGKGRVVIPAPSSATATVMATSSEGAKFEAALNIAAALAWSYGCLETPCPPNLRFPRPAEDFLERASNRWSQNSDYHAEVFPLLCHCPESHPFSEAEISIASEAPGRLLIRTQECIFPARLSKNPVTTEEHILIETADGAEAGVVPVHDYLKRKLRGWKGRVRLFALAVGTPEEMHDYYQLGSVQTSGGRSEEMVYETFLDEHGEAIKEGPVLMRVMLVGIMRETDSHESCLSKRKGISVKRMGIGVVHLKRWLSAHRVFGTFVIE